MKIKIIAVVFLVFLFQFSCKGGAPKATSQGSEGVVPSPSATTSSSSDVVVGVGSAKLYISAGSLPDTEITAEENTAIGLPTLSENGIVITTPVTFKFSQANSASGGDKMRIEFELPKTVDDDKLQKLKTEGLSMLQVMIKVGGTRPDVENLTLSTEWMSALGSYNGEKGTISVPLIASASEISVVLVADKNGLFIKFSKSVKIPMIKNAIADTQMNWWKNDWALLYEPSNNLCSQADCDQFLKDLKEHSEWLGRNVGLTESAVRTISAENLAVLTEASDPAAGRNYTIRKEAVAATFNVARISENGSCGSETLPRGVADTQCLSVKDFCRDYAGHVHFTTDLLQKPETEKAVAIVETLATQAELHYKTPMRNWVGAGIPAALGTLRAFGDRRLWPVYGESYKNFELSLNQSGPLSRQAGEFWTTADFILGFPEGGAFLGQVIKEMSGTAGNDSLVGSTIDRIVGGIPGMNFKELFKSVIVERSLYPIFYPYIRSVEFTTEPMNFPGETAPMSGVIYSFEVPSNTNGCTITLDQGNQDLAINGAYTKEASVDEPGVFAVIDTRSDGQKEPFTIRTECKETPILICRQYNCTKIVIESIFDCVITAWRVEKTGVLGTPDMVKEYRETNGFGCLMPGITLGIPCEAIKVEELPSVSCPGGGAECVNSRLPVVSEDKCHLGPG